MYDSDKALEDLRRPGLLVRAARHGMLTYNRERDLKRLMRVSATPSPTSAVGVLLREEEELDATRREGREDYSVLRHVEVLIALMSEARLLARTI